MNDKELIAFSHTHTHVFSSSFVITILLLLHHTHKPVSCLLKKKELMLRRLYTVLGKEKKRVIVLLYSLALRRLGTLLEAWGDVFSIYLPPIPPNVGYVLFMTGNAVRHRTCIVVRNNMPLWSSTTERFLIFSPSPNTNGINDVDRARANTRNKTHLNTTQW